MEMGLIITKMEQARIGYNTNITKIYGYIVCPIEMPLEKMSIWLDVAIGTIKAIAPKQYQDICQIRIEDSRIYFSYLTDNK